jgi:hypothetical protein
MCLYLFAENGNQWYICSTMYYILEHTAVVVGSFYFSGDKWSWLSCQAFIRCQKRNGKCATEMEMDMERERERNEFRTHKTHTNSALVASHFTQRYINCYFLEGCNFLFSH